MERKGSFFDAKIFIVSMDVFNNCLKSENAAQIKNWIYSFIKLSPNNRHKEYLSCLSAVI